MRGAPLQEAALSHRRYGTCLLPEAQLGKDSVLLHAALVTELRESGIVGRLVGEENLIPFRF